MFWKAVFQDAGWSWKPECRHEKTGNHAMHEEGPTPYSDFSAEFSYGYNDANEYQAQAGILYHPLTPPESDWDPAEELAFMLRDAVEAEQARIPAARGGEPADARSHRENLAQITAELPPIKAATPGHRKTRARHKDKLLTLSYCTGAVVAVIAATVSVFGGVFAYDPLLFIAAGPTASSVVSWWPLLIFGPWLVASLSILRHALHRRRSLHSWCVVLVFSSIAMALCIAQAPNDLMGRAAAAMPIFASLTCFQQLVRQITLTRPPRRPLRRHRLRPTEAPVGGVPSNSGPHSSVR
ncbi:DUF2637 domain-containing protein [Streptomyces sp. NPDC094149]|uniref:DUF2637 domain-containing protein n=1 Tax=Streptomyces sp. NPDC094149 TaxID=3155079 RepID=UPI0033224DC2